MITAKMATLHECATVYSLRDVYDMIEIDRVNNENRKILANQEPKKD